ncbi:MAG TPA: hypothetical protein O0W90_00020, partial [Methanocorpusculum sp.]|nr:hypothetical protein [Methanocorpusculum sp.]
MLIVFICASAFCGCVSAGDTWNGIELNWTWYSDDTSVNEFYIYDEGSLAALSEKTSYNTSTKDFKGKTIHLMDNIDLSSICNASTDTSWKPIGSGKDWGKYKFCGNFEGNCKTISNLYIYKPSDNYQGLFGYTNGANITNLTLTNVNVTGCQHVGGLAGWCRLDTAKTHFIDNCSVSGNISGVNSNIGGLIGTNFGIIKNCITNVYVRGGSTLGGLIGSNNCTLIENCYANAEVSGGGIVGGLVGYNCPFFEDSSTLCIINNCSASGKVYGSGDDVGGLVGYNNVKWNSTISNCYANTDVRGNSSFGGSSHVGGLVGGNTFSYGGTILIENTYAIGNVSGSNKVGGLVGCNGLGGDDVHTIIIIENTYAAGSVSGRFEVGGLVGYNELGGPNDTPQTLYINNSAALNNYVNCSDYRAGRIFGYNKNTNKSKNKLLFNNNYAWEGMKNGDNFFTDTDKNVTNVSSIQVWGNESFYKNDLHWEFGANWSIDEDNNINYPLPYITSLDKKDTWRPKVIHLKPMIVTFNGHGSTSGVMDNKQGFTLDIYKALFENNFKRTGYTFIGWNESEAEPRVDNDYNDQEVIGFSKPDPDNKMLYAVWKGNITNITLYFNNTTSFPSVNQTVKISFDSDTFNPSLTTPAK